MGRRRLVIATANPGKLAEFGELLGTALIDLEAVACDVEESGATYEENAALKARAACCATGLPALGDDSGLEVEALGGEPGVQSKRLAPTQPERNRELWRRLAAVPRPWRARFVCALALATPDGRVQTFRGQVDGEVLPEPRGQGGFGYDPIFLVPEAGRTFAEMDSAEKHRWSHRGRAIRRLLESGALERSATLPV